MAKDSSSGATIVDFPGLQHRMDPEAGAWLTEVRHISPATWEKFPVASGTVFFPELERKSPAIFFQAADGGWKARSYPDKAHTQKKGTEQSFWNLSAVLDGPLDRVYITEGEIDAMSLAEAGIGPNRILSAPSGTTGLAYVEKALAAGLNKCKRFVWCGDQDAVGLALRAEMAKVLGVARFYFIEWPDGIKDANDFLRKDGREDLNDLVRNGAIEWPAEGIFRLSAIADMPPLTRWLTGFDGWAGKVYLAPGTLSVVTGQPGMGKALAIDTPIPTPDGWKAMGDLAPGDWLFDESGQPCRVTFATQEMVDRKCFAVKFDDGSEIVADADHLWLTETESARQSERAWKKRGSRNHVLPRGTDQRKKRILPSVVTTLQISGSLIFNGKRNHAIRLSGPIECAEKMLPIPPYVLGAWLGDGNSEQAAITCADADAEIMEFIASDGVPVSRRQYGDRSPGWGLTDGVRNPYKECVSKSLRRLGLFGNKHIPKIYLRAATQQRLLLLQGLMDTDGYIDPISRACEFCSTNYNLAVGVYELVCSFGVRARISTGRATINGRDCGPKYRVGFSTAVPVFRLSRKRRLIPNVSRRKYRYIVSCDPVPSVPVRCIQVDSPSCLYLAGRSFIATHNTQLWSQIWFQVAHAHDVVVAAASFETRPKPHYQRTLQQLHGRGLIQNLDGRAIAAANKWIDDHYLFLLHPERRPTLEWTLDQAEIAVVRYGAKVVKIDPWNRMEPNREGKESETEYASRCLRALYNFAVDFGVHVQVVAHPAKSNEYRRFAVPTLEDIAGSKHWDNMVDQGFVVHRPRLFDDEGNRVTYSELHHVKARFEELGYPSKFGLEFDVDQGRFGVCPLAKKKIKSPREEAQTAKSSDYDQGNFDQMKDFEP